MKNKRTFNLLASAFAVVFLLALVATDGWGQNFTNNLGGNYTSTDGVIRMRNVGGVFNGTAQLGTTPIEGIVAWSAAAAGQQVQGLQYTNMVVEGGAKTILDGVQIYGSGGVACAYSSLLGPGLGYAVGTAGARTYQGTFSYMGASDQTIWAEYNSGGSENNFNNLSLQGNGAKTMGGDIGVNVGLNVSAATTLTVDALLMVSNTTAANSTIAGTINVVSGGNLNVRTSGADLQIGGLLNLADASDADLTLQNGAKMTVSGNFTNDRDERDNMNFANSGVCSVVEYVGNRTNVVTSVAGFPYGSLIFSGGSGNTAYQATANTGSNNNIFLTCDLTVNGDGINGASLNMAASTGGFLQMTDGAANYDGGTAHTSEVIGEMRRTVADLATLTPWVMNNAGTSLNYSTLPASGWVGLISAPGTDPANYNGTNPLLANTIQRRVRYTSELSTGVIGAFTIGYRSTAETRSLTPEQLTRLLPYEGHTPGSNGQLINSTGSTSANGTNVFGSNGSFNVIAAAGGGNNDDITNGSDIFGAYSGVFSIADGRWTDGRTWVNAWIPLASDEVEIRHVVFTGYDGNTVLNSYPGGYNWPDNESTVGSPIVGEPGARKLAKSVTIRDIDVLNPALGPDIALLIGNSDADILSDVTLVFGNTTDPGSLKGLYNSNNEASTWNFDWTNLGQSTTLNGLWLNSCTIGTVNSIIRASQVTNAGAIVNRGIIEVGD